MAIIANREDDLKYKKQQIELFFSVHPDMNERADYLHSAYLQRYTEVIVDGVRVGYMPQENGLLMWEGAYLSRTKESVFSWGLVAEWVSALIEKKEYFISTNIKAPASHESLQTSFYDPDFSVPQGPAGQMTLFPRPQLSQQIIDEALCVGANDPSSRLIICAYLMKDKPLEENARFLREHYGENGAGFYFGDRKISVWYNTEGIRVDSGETAQRSTATVLSWKDAAKRIRELLDLGRYMPQSEIDQTAEFEKMRLADDLLLMYQDIDGDNKETYFLTMKPAYEVHGGFPEMSAAVKKLLEQPDRLQALADECRAFIDAYGKNRDILRFHYYRPKQLLQRLTDLQREPLTFTAAEGYDPQRRFFISGDELDQVLRGSTDYRLAVYSFYRNNPDKKAWEKCLKDYYGECSGHYGGNDIITYSSKGLLFGHGDISEPYAKIELSWAKITKRVSELISSGKFISAADQAAMPDYERNQLARDVHAFFDDASVSFSKPFPRDMYFSDAIGLISRGLQTPSDVEEIYQMMLPVLESTTQDDRSYPRRKRAFENLSAFRNGTFSLFGEVKMPKAPEPPAELLQPTESLSPAAESPVPVAELPAAAVSAKPDTDADLKQAKALINAYCIEEFDQEADFSNLSYVDLAYSTTEESDLPIQIHADLTASKLVYTVDGETVREISCESLSELHKYLADLDFDSMIADAEEAFAQIQQEQEPGQEPEQESEQESPAKSSAEVEKSPAELPAEEEQLRLKSIVIDLTPHSEHSSRDGNESLIGRRLVMDDRVFEVESVSDFSGDVSLRDVTFESSVGIPITRVEKLGTVRQLLAQAEKESPLAPPAPRRKKASPFTLHPEIPAEQRSNYRITDDHFAEGGAKTKFHNNLAAIRTLQQIEAENRLAAPEEQETLARYVGWGGLPQAFDENNDAWAKESAELRALLSDAEYRAARATTLNAHYTSPTVIKAIYKAIESTGFRSGNVLEPSCGIGNFFGLVPESMAGARLYGVELDSVTGRIARQLYQNNRIAVQGFESANLPDSFFDLAVGNVPFGNYSLPDKRYDKHRFLIHDYFFAKTLDKVRPGGIIAFVTSKGTMDKKDPSVRRYLAQRAELVGAIRLPNNAFLANAGTQVTTDILFLQKREKMIEANPEWLHLGETETGVPINQYFLSHPEMVLGEMVFDESMYGNKAETSCHPFENAGLAELLDKAIQNIHTEYTPYAAAEVEAEEDEAIPADPSVRNFSYTDLDGELFYRENSLMFPVKQSLTGKSRIRGMLAIRDCVRRLIACQTENTSDQEITGEQARLNQLYDTFTAKYGLLNSRANSAAFSADSSFPLLCALEILDENGSLERKADMFTKRTIQPYVSVDRVDTASEALAVSIGEKARVDLRFMASLMDGEGGKEKTIEQIKRDLAGVIFRDPETYVGAPLAGWQTADAYLSGRVKEKLASAKLAAARDPAYAVNVTALERVQPKDLTAGEISVRLGTTWVPAGIIEQFIYQLLATPAYHQRYIKVSYSKTSGEWNVSEKSRDRSNVRANNIFGTRRINAYKIIEQSLNLRDVRIFDTIQTEQGERRVLNKKETAIAQDKQDAIRQKFKDWIWTDPKRREFLCRFYNDRFNSVRPREYDGQHIRFVGMNPAITLRTHQRNAIARALYGGNALFGHVVGAGKSFEMIATAMEAKRLGLSSKSMFVVPNNIIGDFAADFLKLYPSANILVTTKRDFEKQNRKKFCARIATGDYDGVIIGHSQFEKIPLSAERQIAMLERQIDELMQGIQDAKAEEGARFNIKQMEKSRKNLEAKLKRLMEAKERDDTVTFEELGIDRLFVDEADMFKNLFLYTKMRNVGGISQTEAQKSSDLFMKCQYIDELTGGKGVVFATGTPVSNSMAELYTMQRYLQYSTLERMELLHFDSWAAQFGETVTTMELKPEGSGFQQKTRFSNFYNLPELMAMFKEVADIQTADMLNLPVPKANFHTVVCKPSEIQKEMVEALGERAEQVRNGEVDANEDNMLLITNDGRKLALDQRLMNPMLPDFEESKVNVCADNIYRIWERTSENRLTQLVFCDLSTPKNDGTFSVYNDLLDKLTGRGIPAEEIAFVHSANNEAQKKELFAKVRKGTIRILLGSTEPFPVLWTVKKAKKQNET